MNNRTHNASNDKTAYIARIIDEREESVCSHSMDTAYLAERNAPKKLKFTAKLIALLHDAGKNCKEFLQYIRKITKDPKSVKKGSVVHSTAGGIIVNDLASKNNADIFTAEVVRHVVISHHGINDCISPDGKSVFKLRSEKQNGIDDIRKELYSYLPEKELAELFAQSSKELSIVVHMIAELTKDRQFGARSFYWGMLTRLLLSLLIDADRTASACFAKNIRPEPIIVPTKGFWQDLIEKLEQHISEKPCNTKIEQLRQEISTAYGVAGKTPGKILRLVLPTGAGKTLSSLRYALYQAREFDKKRIVYVSPLNSILEQNSQVFREALGCPGIEIILEHHSNLIPDDTEKYKELTQNWNAPIVLTSAVQFLNSLFSAKSGAIRRMYALTDSVIIVDEIQSMPLKCIALFNMAMNFLAGICDATIVLCSATQPPFEALPENRMLTPMDMLPDSARYKEAFRRTRIIDMTELIPGGMDARTAVRFVVDLYKTESSILFIVNTKKCAEAIYHELKERFSGFSSPPKLFHLSTNMCPKHRKKVLETIKKMKTEEAVICVSTQLIEAGVDISFKSVIRSAAGLQNAVQSAGRSNRNAEVACGYVYIIKLTETLEKLSNLPEIREAQDAFYSLISSSQDIDLDSTEAMDAYYGFYYIGNEQKMCYPGPYGSSLVDLLSHNPAGVNNLRRAGLQVPILSQAFKTAGEHFQVIEEKDMVDIMVEYDKTSTLFITQLNSNLNRQELEKLLPQLQPYTVSVSQTMIRSLGNAIYPASNGAINILKKQFYNQETGVSDTPSQMDYCDPDFY